MLGVLPSSQRLRPCGSALQGGAPQTVPRRLDLLFKAVPRLFSSADNFQAEDMLVILALASLCLPVAVEFTETEANQALKRWLEEDGSMLRIDHVELRRTLIDLCFWIRDGYGHAYWRPLLRQDHIGYKHIEVLQTINVTQFVEEARAREDDLRAKRKVMHTQGGRSNPATGLEVESGRCPD